MIAGTSDLNLAMTLSLRDKLIAPLRQAVDQAERELKGLGQQGSRAATELNKVADNLGKVSRAGTGMRTAAEGLRRVGQEAEAAERHVSRLAQAGGRLRNFMQGATGVVAGTTAFSMVAADPLRQAANYDTELRRLANTAYAGRPLAERRAGLGQLNAAITGAIRSGGGTREQALAALNELVASGAFSDVGEAAALLPSLMRGATASGANPAELAMIAIRSKQSMGLSGAELPRVLDMAMAAGQAGGFELRDLARWLPQQMALARSLGMTGTGGIAELLAANQASVITAGSRDEAGNNLVNLLAKINSADTARDFANLGIDLSGSLAAASSKGVSALQGFVNIVEQVSAADPRFAAARRAYAAASTDDERRAALGSQVDLLQGSSIGRVIQDRQALMALVALMGNRGYLSDVRSAIASSGGAIDSAAALMIEGPGYVYDQRQFEVQRAQTEAMTSANSAVTQLAQAQIDLYQRYPGFAATLEGAKVAVASFAAALAVAAGTRVLFNPTPAGNGRIPTGAAGGAGAGAAVAGRAAGLVGVGGTLAAVAAANVVANNLDAFGSTTDGMLGAMSGDTGFAAAILEAAESGREAATAAKQAAQAAQAAASRPIQLHLPDGRELTMTVDQMMEQDLRRR